MPKQLVPSPRRTAIPFSVTLKLSSLPPDDPARQSDQLYGLLVKALEETFEDATSRPRIAHTQTLPSGDVRVFFSDPQGATQATQRMSAWTSRIRKSLHANLPQSHNAIVLHNVPLDVARDSKHLVAI